MQASAKPNLFELCRAQPKISKANFRASECRAELVRAMPNTAENIELVKIRATDQVAINIIEHVSCKFVKFVGKKSEIRGP